MTFIKGGKHTSKCFEWFITIILIILAIVSIVIVIIDINKKDTNNRYINNQHRQQYYSGDRQQYYSGDRQQYYSDDNQYVETFSPKRITNDITTKDDDSKKYSSRPLYIKFMKLIKELTAWRITGKKEMDKRNDKSNTIDTIAYNITTYLDNNETQYQDSMSDEQIDNSINKILKEVENNLQQYADTTTDDSGKYTYTVDDNMYTYKKDNNSIQTTYNIETDTYTTTNPEETETITYDNNEQTIQYEDNEMDDKNINEINTEPIINTKQTEYSSTYIEPEYDNITQYEDNEDDTNENETYNDVQYSNPFNNNRAQYEDMYEQFTNNSNVMLENHLINVLKIIHDKYA